MAWPQSIFVHCEHHTFCDAQRNNDFFDLGILLLDFLLHHRANLQPFLSSWILDDLRRFPSFRDCKDVTMIVNLCR